jgi:ferritin
MPKTAEYFHCELCDFNCSKKSNYNAHLLTRKHKMLTNADNKMPKNAEFVCDDCGKLYKHRQSLHVHKRKCSVKKDTIAVIDKDPTSGDSTIEYLLKENSEMKQMIMEMMGKMGNTTNNTTNNNQFNINMFLNDQCKNAVNFSDFIDRIEISHDDLENNAQLGFVNGMTKILMDNLRMLTLHERPIHCTDVKRETFYIKDQDVWEKERSTVKLENAIQEVSRKSLKSLIDWKKKNPDYDDLDSEFSKKSIHIQQNSSGLCQKESFYPKIIHHLAKGNSISQLKN